MTRVEVQRLARALSEFWHGGGGPSTHDELGYAFEDAGLDQFDAELIHSYAGSKRDRVNRAVRLAAEHNRLWPLVAGLVASLHDARLLDTDEAPEYEERAVRLRRVLADMGRGVAADGSLTGGVSPAVAERPDTLLGIPVARDHIERLHDAVRREDVANMVGISKELLESVVHIVLRDREVEVDDDWDLIKLAKEAQKALLLHGSVHDVENDFIGERIKRILSSLSNIAAAVIELRNEMGTGHGRVEPPQGVKPRHAKVAAGAAIVYSEMMLDTLQDSAAPWPRAD